MRLLVIFQNKGLLAFNFHLTLSYWTTIATSHTKQLRYCRVSDHRPRSKHSNTSLEGRGYVLTRSKNLQRSKGQKSAREFTNQSSRQKISELLQATTRQTGQTNSVKFNSICYNFCWYLELENIIINLFLRSKETLGHDSSNLESNEKGTNGRSFLKLKICLFLFFSSMEIPA